MYNSNFKYFDKIIDVKYKNRQLFISEAEEVADAWQEFNEAFDSFICGNAYEYQKMWDAWSEEYDPLHNYDGKEVVTTEIDERTNKDVNPDLVIRNSGGTSTSTVKSSPYDADFQDVSKDETNIGQTSQTTEAHTLQHIEGAGKSKVTTEKGGNLGVTTSQQMIQSELDLRAKGFILEIIKDIINQITIY